MSALRNFTIIELAEDVAGEYCGKLLADFGAEIIKIERAGSGSPVRAMPPLAAGCEAPEASLVFAYLNTNKQSVALDLGLGADLAVLAALLDSADAIIDDHGRDWLARHALAPEALAASHPGLVLCSVTGFGMDAAADQQLATSLNVLHSSGWGYHTPSPADPDRPPLKGPGRFLADYDSGLEAAICLISALYARGRTGAGECIDISKQAVLVSRADTIVGRMLAGDIEATPDRSAFARPTPASSFACAGGFVFLYLTSRAHWLGLRKLMGEPAWLADYAEDWLEFGLTDASIAQFRAGFAAWVADKNRDAICEAAQHLGVPLVPVHDAADLQLSPQFQHRGFFQKLEHPLLGAALYPTVAYKLSASPARLTRHAPLLGEHNEALARRKGRAAPGAARQDRPAQTRGGPLAGLRVLEMTKVWAGPYAGKLLAFLGAEVIKIESLHNMDEMRAYGNTDPDHAPYFLSLNPEILSVQLNTKTAEGLHYLRQLIAKSDVILNNIRPGAMERSGLGYAALREIKPDIISVSIKMHGNDGPLAYQTGYAPCFAAAGGMNYLVGYAGEPPLGMNIAYGDSTCGATAVLGTLAAVMHRERTGEGQFVDVSAVESISALLGDSLLEYGFTGEVPGPDGNRHAGMAPHGCYPCRNQEWISIAVAAEAQWRAVCQVLGAPGMADDAAFASLAARHANALALDAWLAGLTRGHHAGILAGALRQSGVPAFKSLDAVSLLSDDRLWQREIFTTVSDAVTGQRWVTGPSWRLARNPAGIARGAPKLGEHNAYVFKDILGVTEATMAGLIASGVIA